MNNSEKYLPLIIIGAPRSGTNMLRDVLANINGFATWPCDEINYIWRHGNVRVTSDEISVDRARPYVKSYIRKRFSDIQKKYNADVVVEKTCANSLRVPFVSAVFPNAKYVFIVRDGIDATASAKQRWHAKLDIHYILRKVRFVPKLDLPYYAIRYFWARLYLLISRGRRLAFWGPALSDMAHILRAHTLEEVCALQWQRCVEKSEEAFATMPPEKVIRVRYEDFVREPRRELCRILKFVEKDADPGEINSVIKEVSPRSLGKGRKYLGEEQVANLEALIGETL